jgi:tRNA nucleotidyltransferase (CCA-adding enzyme)
VCALPGVKAWIEDALAEKDFVAFDEPYRIGALTAGPRGGPYTAPMQTYMVGGAVRDALLGLPVNDRDWVVVGATPEAMIDAGYLPVGRDFPVFLHPETREEYALARTERKTGRGYHGFAFHADPGVTLEEDLARRDLTINAMAQDDAGQVIDPFHGRRDLDARVLRHVTDAFREDPVRILRLARFAARFTDFSVAPETLALMRAMVEEGEVDHLVPERVWQELARGLMEPKPSRMLEVLRDCGALARLLPEVDRLWGVPQRADYHPEVDTGVHLMMVLDMSARLQAPLPVRFACLTHDLGKGTTPVEVLPRHIGHEERSARLLKKVCNRLRVPTDCHELADVVAREHGNIHRSAEFSAAALVRLLERCDAFRKPQRFADALLACECDARGRLGLEDKPYPQRARLLAALEAARQVATADVAAEAASRGLDGPKVGEMIHAARVAAVQEGLFGG